MSFRGICGIGLVLLPGLALAQETAPPQSVTPPAVRPTLPTAVPP